MKSAPLQQIRGVFAGARERPPEDRCLNRAGEGATHLTMRRGKPRPVPASEAGRAASRRRQAIEGSLIRKPTVNQVSGRIVLIALVAISVVTAVTIPAAAEAVVVANVGGVRLEAAALAEAAAAEAATASESAAASNKGAAASAASVAGASAARASAPTAANARAPKSRKCSLDR
jgi:hypothetical protein